MIEVLKSGAEWASETEKKRDREKASAENHLGLMKQLYNERFD